MSLTTKSGGISSSADALLERKARLCAEILGEARRLVGMRMFGGTLNQLILRAHELLDDMDELRISEHVPRGVYALTGATESQRILTQVQSAVAEVARNRAVRPTRVRKPACG
jgi:hypothetical protein